MFIDFHTHIFPDDSAGTILKDMAGRGDISHFTDGTHTGLLGAMARSKIDISIVSRITTQAEKVDAVNQWLNQCAGPAVRPMATFHPDLSVTSDDLKAIQSKGFVGIKLHPDYQDFFVDDVRMYPFYEAAQATGIPVLFHAGLDRGLPPPVHATPQRLLKVHRQFPRMVMVAAHMGGEDNYKDTEVHLLGKEIYLDTSYVLRIMNPNTLQRFFRKHSVDRILFGSDSPFTDQAKELDYLLNLDFLTDLEKEKVAGGNAMALLNLKNSKA
jgi:predicted TIM-barrel fold metal-dependent hydrolase